MNLYLLTNPITIMFIGLISFGLLTIGLNQVIWIMVGIGIIGISISSYIAIRELGSNPITKYSGSEDK